MKDDDRVPAWTEPGPTAYPMVRRETDHVSEGVYEEMSIADLRKAAEAAGMRLERDVAEQTAEEKRSWSYARRVAELEGECRVGARALERVQAERDDLRSRAKRAETDRDRWQSHAASMTAQRDEARRGRDALAKERDRLAVAESQCRRDWLRALREKTIVEKNLKTVDEAADRLAEKLAEMRKERDEARQAQPSVVPVEAVRELWEAVKRLNDAECESDEEEEAVQDLYELCRGKLRDTFAALDQPGAVIAAESESDAEVLRNGTGDEEDGPFWPAYNRATIIERRHIDVLRAEADFQMRGVRNHRRAAAIREALDATEPKK